MTAATLRSHTCKDLAQMAKQHGVPGWHSMRKDQLIKALLKTAKQERAGKSRGRSRSRTGSPNGNGTTKSGRHPLAGKNGQGKSAAKAKNSSNPRIQKKIYQLQAKLERAKNLAAAEIERDGDFKDRLIVMVRDPYWLHAYWELSRNSISRVQAALGHLWHTAKPQLRLFEVTENDSGTPSETHLRSIDIHGCVKNWYVDIHDPPCAYRMDIGYLAGDNTFHAIARSNIVTPPAAGCRDALDENWSDVARNFDRIYAMSGGYSQDGGNRELRELMEERLRRPMGAPAMTRYGTPIGSPDRENEFQFEADAEMIVYGAARPGSQVTLAGEPVQLRPDGTFTVRLNMPDRRQVIPVVASSSDGVEQRTIVIAVERNTKRMETVVRDLIS